MSNIFHVIKDPVHGTMQFSSQTNAWIKPFIDSENFQRLRHVNQLGLADWVFPGAVHSRFSHGLGCCYVVSEICNKLELSDEDKQLVILAGLMHDVGHGPFSHMFEAIFRDHSIRHELWTPFFLAEYITDEFFDRFNRANKNFPLTKEKIIQIQNLITGKFSGDKLLADMVSSQLDADRLDYLLRDSHFCGVTYGNYEFRWLLHCLTIVDLNGERRLGVTRKGVGVVEEYLMARRLMIRNVYQHGKKCGAEFFMQNFLQELANGLANDKLFSNLEATALLQFLQKMNVFNEQLTTTKDKQALIKHFVRDNYYLYKQLCDYDIFLLIRELATWEDKHPAVALAKRLQNRILPKVIPLNSQHVAAAEALIKEFALKFSVPDWQLSIITLPHSSYTLSEDPILVQESTGALKHLHKESLMVDALSDKSENHYLACIDQLLISRKEGEKLYNALREI